MLKPSDKWNWYFDEQKACLMLDLGEEMIFQTNLSRKLLVNCAFSNSEFTVDDASAFQTFNERIRCLDISEYRQAELTLYCVAAKRFHKPYSLRAGSSMHSPLIMNLKKGTWSFSQINILMVCSSF